jgi:2-methylisocitrate lyase-like PEP mutase family enzyme
MQGAKMAYADRLHKALKSQTCCIAPGAYDAWSAKLIERAGFEMCYLTGFGASASHLGAPDIGLMTSTEMANLASRVASAISIPVIADADTGYGNTVNVRHTAKLYTRAGVAAMQLEDQEFPKRCGHLDGKQVVSVVDMVDKIKAAKDEVGSELLIVARTDARAILGLENALDRGYAYKEAGADILFIEAPRTLDEMQEICRNFPDTPLIANMVEGGKTPYLSGKELTEIGFSIAIYPITTLLASTGMIEHVLRQLKNSDKISPNDIPSFSDLHDISGLDNYLADARTTDN